MIYKKILHWLLFTTFIFISSNDNKTTPVNLPADSIATITISFVGDIMCHSPQFEIARVSQDSFDFTPVFRYVKSYLSSPDIMFGNFETVTAEDKFSGYPMFNSPVQLLDALKEAGFDFLFTSNNHSLDRGEKGIIQTIAQLDSRNLQHTGTFTSQNKRDSTVIVTANGIKLAMLAYTYGVNGNKIPKNYFINVIDTSLIKSDIARAKALQPDAVIVYFHFGDEYKREPNKFQKLITAKTVEYGADYIIASHPHVIQPLDFLSRKDSLREKVFVAYSLGNFISNQRDRYKDSGVILNLVIEKNMTKKSMKLKEFSYIPTWVFKGNTGQSSEYLILPSRESLLDSTLTFLNSQNKTKLKQSLLDTEEILTKLISKKTSSNL